MLIDVYVNVNYVCLFYLLLPGQTHGGRAQACEEIVASDPSARRAERSDETYLMDRRGVSTAQQSNRIAQQICS
jgi:hypothetical protein